MYNTSSDPLFENTVATYTCNTGYILSGNITRTCGSDGQWRGSALVCQCELFYKPVTYVATNTYTDRILSLPLSYCLF